MAFEASVAPQLVRFLEQLVCAPNPEDADIFYCLLGFAEPAQVIDEFLGLAEPVIAARRQEVACLARQILVEAPDIRPVKVAIALLGAAGDRGDAELLLKVGAHDSLTTIAAVALANLSPGLDHSLWELARSATGWRRNCCIHLLAETGVPEIRRWLVREAHLDCSPVEEVALVCAETGGLLDEMRAHPSDANLLQASAALLRALTLATPRPRLLDFAGGEQASLLFLGRLCTLDRLDVRLLDAALALHDLVTGNWWGALRTKAMWTSASAMEVRTRVGSILRSRAGIRAFADGLSAAGVGDFEIAIEMAQHFRVDPWRARLERQRTHPEESHWEILLETDEVRSALEVIELLDDLMSTGWSGSADQKRRRLEAGVPRAQPGLHDDALETVLVALARFPGCGGHLVTGALRAGPDQLRRDAIRVLEAWSAARWPLGVGRVLTQLPSLTADIELGQRALMLARRAKREAD